MHLTALAISALRRISNGPVIDSILRIIIRWVAIKSRAKGTVSRVERLVRSLMITRRVSRIENDMFTEATNLKGTNLDRVGLELALA